MRNKVYKYAVFFFPDGETIGMARTSKVCNGYKGQIKEGEMVELNWEGTPVFWKILFLHGKYWSLDIALLTSTIREKREYYEVSKIGCALKPREPENINGISLLFCVAKKNYQLLEKTSRSVENGPEYLNKIDQLIDRLK